MNQLKYTLPLSLFYSVLEQFPKATAEVKIGRKIYLSLNAKVGPSVSYPELARSGFEFAVDQLKSLNLIIGHLVHQPDIADNAILESRAPEK